MASIFSFDNRPDEPDATFYILNKDGDVYYIRCENINVGNRKTVVFPIYFSMLEKSEPKFLYQAPRPMGFKKFVDVEIPELTIKEMLDFLEGK